MTDRTDRQRALFAIAHLACPFDDFEQKALTDLGEVLAKAQNGPPLGGADGSLTEEQWHALQDFLKVARAYNAALTKACEVLANI